MKMLNQTQIATMLRLHAVGEAANLPALVDAYTNSDTKASDAWRQMRDYMGNAESPEDAAYLGAFVEEAFTVGGILADAKTRKELGKDYILPAPYVNAKTHLSRCTSAIKYQITGWQDMTVNAIGKAITAAKGKPADPHGWNKATELFREMLKAAKDRAFYVTAEGTKSKTIIGKRRDAIRDALAYASETLAEVAALPAVTEPEAKESNAPEVEPATEVAATG